MFSALFYASTCFAGLVIAYFTIPETKGQPSADKHRVISLTPDRSDVQRAGRALRTEDLGEEVQDDRDPGRYHAKGTGTSWPGVVR